MVSIRDRRHGLLRYTYPNIDKAPRVRREGTILKALRIVNALKVPSLENVGQIGYDDASPRVLQRGERRPQVLLRLRGIAIAADEAPAASHVFEHVVGAKPDR